jgi:hypothetical protein
MRKKIEEGWGLGLGLVVRAQSHCGWAMGQVLGPLMGPDEAYARPA